MKAISTLLASLAFCLLAVPNVAHAQATRTWISGVGDDVNPCSRTAPCKTFAGAISKTSAGGEINCLDPGGFGAVTITKSINLNCVGVIGGILTSGTNGVVINAAATDVIYLSGLDFDGLGSSLNGINILNALKVTVDNCLIRGFTNGINVTNGSNGIRVDVIDTVIENNTAEGIFVKPSGSVATRVMIDHVTVSESGGDGILLNGTATTGGQKMSIRNSEVVHSSATGIGVNTGAAPAEITVDSTNVFDNTNGIASNGSGAQIYVSKSVISGNATGINQVTGSSITSYGNNSVDGNTLGNTPFGTTSSQ